MNEEILKKKFNIKQLIEINIIPNIAFSEIFSKLLILKILFNNIPFPIIEIEDMRIEKYR